MSNEVEIVIRDTDRTGPGAASAKRRMEGFARDSERHLQDSGKRSGEKYAKGISDGAKKSTAELLSIGKATEKVDADLGKLRREAAQLAQQFASTGDKDALKKLRDVRGVINNLQTVRRHLADVEDDATKHGSNSGHGFIKGMASRITSEGPAALSGALSSAGKVAGPVGAVVGGAVASQILASASAVLSAGAAAGTLGLGALILKENPEVRKAASSVMESLKDTLAGAAQPLVEPFIASLNRIDREAQMLRPQLRGLFVDAAPAAEKLTDVIVRFTKAALPGVRTLVSESGPALDAFGDSAEQLGRDFSIAMRTMTEDAGENADALRDLASATGTAVVATAEMVNASRDVFEMSKGPLYGPIMAATEKWKGSLDASSNSLSSQADHMRTAKREGRHLRGVYQSLSDSALELAGVMLDSDEAMVAFARTSKEASKTIRDNGKSLSYSTEKGLENNEALIDLARSAQRMLAANKEAGESSKYLATAQDQAYSSFVKAARGAGMTKTAVDKLARRYGLLPAAKETKIKAPGALSAKKNVDALRGSIKNLKGKTITIATVYKNYGGEEAARGRYAAAGLGKKVTGGIIGSAQTGGIRGNSVLVGEHAPEIVELPVGSRVNSGPDSQRMMAGAGTREPSVVEIRSSGRAVDDFIVEIVRRAAKDLGGGDVQLAFGVNR